MVTKKFIEKEAVTPHGVIAKVHRLAGINFSEIVVATVNSFADANSEGIVWQDTHDIPLEEFVGAGNPADAVLNWLLTNVFVDGLIIEGPSDMETERRKLINKVNTVRDIKIHSGCNTPSGRVDTDNVSLRNILGTYQKAVLSKIQTEEFVTGWRLQDNTMVEVTADDMIAIGDAALYHTQLCYQRSWELKAAYEAATTTDELAAVLVNEGWPE